MPQSRTPTPLTAQDIREIVGRIGDDQLTAILATGATAAQVLEAFTWLTGDEYLGGKLEKPLTGVVADVFDILKAYEPDMEDARPRST